MTLDSETIKTIAGAIVGICALIAAWLGKSRKKSAPPPVCGNVSAGRDAHIAGGDMHIVKHSDMAKKTPDNKA